MTIEEQLDFLSTFITKENVSKISQYKWWVKHPFIKSISIDYKMELDDNGGMYRAYQLDDIKIKDTKAFLDYLISIDYADIVERMFNLEKDSLKDNKESIDKVYKLAKNLIGNESQYDLIYELEDALDIRDTFYNDTAFYRLVESGDNVEIFLRDLLRLN